jgi:hypothetical protein
MKHAELWKQILAGGIVEQPRTHTPPLVPRIIKAPIIVDTRPPNHERRYKTVADIDGLSFPFQEFWVEWTGVTEIGNPIKLGTLISAFQGFETQVINKTPMMVSCFDDHEHKSIFSAVCEFIFAGGSRKFYPTRVGAAFFTVRDGSLRSSKVTAQKDMLLYPNEEQNKEATEVLAKFTQETLDLIVMLSCKNISLAPRRQPDAEAVKEATRRNGGHAAGYRYHVLVVRPPGAKSDHPGEEIGNMPRHVCRGHFAEYGPKFGKGLLFGRLEGRFYVPPHMKGDAKNGTVLKDYEVATNLGT